MNHRNPVRSQMLPSQAHAPIGFIRPGHVERAFRTLLYSALLLLVLLSVFGTFYGMQGKAAPIDKPILVALGSIAADVATVPSAFGIALAIQAILTIIQYGARQLANRNPRWWILYLVSLTFSVYYNYQAYWTPLSTLAPPYLAGLLIIAGDVLPEFIAVRRE